MKELCLEFYVFQNQINVHVCDVLLISRVGSEERQSSADDSYCLLHPHIKNGSSAHLLLASAVTLI